MLARRDPRSRDLPPPGGPVARLNVWAGDMLIWGTNLFRRRVLLGVRLIAFDAEGRVFLVRHNYRPGWHLPGGGVERGETALAAAVREASEEGGLVFDAEPRLLHLYHHATTGRYDHIAVFVVEGARQVPGAGRPGLEIRESGFFDPAALPEGVTPATRARIAETCDGAPRSDLW